MRLKKAVKWAVAAALLVGIGFLFRGCFPPSQRSLVRNFHRHRDSFEKLLVMMNEDRDSVRSVASYGVQGLNGVLSGPPEDVGLSEQRYREYRRLLNDADVCWVARLPDETRFLVARSGFGSHGWGVAIVHRDTEPTVVIGTLSEFRPDGTSSGTNEAYCRIADNWYIWISW